MAGSAAAPALRSSPISAGSPSRGRSITRSDRTRVGIVGAGPSGLMLSHLLAMHGIDSVVIESRSRAYVEQRIRAGVLEHATIALLREVGLGARMDAIGLRHTGTLLLFDGSLHRIDFEELTGKSVMVYGQHEVVRDLIAARVAADGRVVFEAEGIAFDGIETNTPSIRYRHEGAEHALACDFIAGCDGFHGIARQAIGALAVYDRVYPFGWLGILAEVEPASEELIYAQHDHGFALLSMRSPTVSRMYLQCEPDESLEAWPDQRIWDELATRLHTNGINIAAGPVVQKGVTPMRSHVVDPMQRGRLFLLGDAAHIVPPTGAKGMNSAIGDVVVFARALDAHYAGRGDDRLAAYSATCLRRIWKTQRFSWWLTSLMHRFPDHSPFERQVQVAELDYVVRSRAASTALAEQYVGLGWDS